MEADDNAPSSSGSAGQGGAAGDGNGVAVTRGGRVPRESRRRRTIRVDLDWRTALGVALALLGIVLLFRVVTAARDALTWIVLGVLFALALEPVVQAAERLLKRRWAAAAVVTLVGITAAAAALVLVIPVAAREAGRFADDAPRLVERIGDIPLVGDRLVEAEVPDRIETWVKELPTRLGTEEDPLESVFESVLNGLAAALATAAMVVAVLLDGQRLRTGVKRMIPPRRRATADQALDILYRTVGKYFAGSLLVAFLAGCGVLIVGLLAGVPLAPVAALWVMTTNLIPQVGGFLGGSLFVLLGATQGPTTALICLGWFLAYQQFENNVLQPTIIGDAVDLSPPITMIAALIGASAFGVPGALVAIPTLGTVKAILVELGFIRVAGRDDGEGPGRKPGRLRRLLKRRSS